MFNRVVLGVWIQRVRVGEWAAFPASEMIDDPTAGDRVQPGTEGAVLRLVTELRHGLRDGDAGVLGDLACRCVVETRPAGDAIDQVAVGVDEAGPGRVISRVGESRHQAGACGEGIGDGRLGHGASL